MTAQPDCGPDCACPCRQSPSARLKSLGIREEDLLGLLERRLLYVLYPPDAVVLYPVIWAALHPDDPWTFALRQTQNLSSLIYRVRKLISPHGWTVDTLERVGYRLRACAPSQRPPQRFKTISRIATFLDSDAQQDAFCAALEAGQTQIEAAHTAGTCRSILDLVRMRVRDDDPLWMRIQAARRTGRQQTGHKNGRPIQTPPPRPATALDRALAGMCTVAGCPVPLAGHPRCTTCELLIGTQHTNQTVNAAGRCSWCAAQRETFQRGATGLQQGDRQRAARAYS